MSTTQVPNRPTLNAPTPAVQRWSVWKHGIAAAVVASIRGGPDPGGSLVHGHPAGHPDVRSRRGLSRLSRRLCCGAEVGFVDRVDEVSL
jgi:hypothetical protein